MVTIKLKNGKKFENVQILNCARGYLFFKTQKGKIVFKLMSDIAELIIP